MGGTTNWRGVTLDPRTAAMMDEVVRLCPGVPINPSQGSWSGAEASAGTHSGCGAIDLEAASLSSSQRTQVETAMRQVGMFGSVRDPSQGKWPWHLHGIAVQAGGKGDPGCLSMAAHDQVIDYYEGRNGLKGGNPDKGSRAYVGVTWETYKPGGAPGGTEDEMKLVQSVNKGCYLLVGGYWRWMDEETRDAFLEIGVPIYTVSDRAMDVLRAGALYGEAANNPPKY